MAELLDQWGRPVVRSELVEELAGPTLSGLRSPARGYPGDGLDPRRLASILREADAGNPVRYMELAETIEERNAHYLGVLGTRRRSVTQLEITVEDASDDPIDVEICNMVRDWLKRGELQTELFHLLDAIGKGYSFTEVLWDTSTGQWWPERLEWRDPRWFGWDQVGLTRPQLRDRTGVEKPLPGYKFVYADFKAKSGIPLRGGLARVVLWPHLFRAFAERDWAIFCQNYGQPARLGKFGPQASEKDRATLLRAVTNIAGDLGAIIPESMQLEFLQSGNISASSDLYKERALFYNDEISKAVLGQTGTTDAKVGGLGSGKEHRLVQEDIERADANDLAAVLTRDLLIPFIRLNVGDRPRYPRFVIARPEQEDLKAWTETVLPWAEAGLPIASEDVYAKIGLRQPAEGDRLLPMAGRSSAPADRAGTGTATLSSDRKSALLPKTTPQDADPRRGERSTAAQSAVKYPFNTRLASQGGTVALSGQMASEGRSDALSPMVDRLAEEASPSVTAMVEQIETMLSLAETFEEFREMLEAGFDRIDSAELSEALGLAMTAGFAGGMAAIEDEADG